MLDEIVRPYADLETVSIADGLVSLRFSGVTLRETAEIVRELDRSPIVSRTTVSTAATVENPTAGAGRTEASGAQGQSGDEQNSSVQAPDGEVQTQDVQMQSETVQNPEEQQGQSGDVQTQDMQMQSETMQNPGEQGQSQGGSAQVSAERRGNEVTANILIALQKESGEEGVTQ